MRILYAVHALPAAGLGGTELYTQQLAETIAEDHDVAIATPAGHETDVAGAEVYPLPDDGDWTDPTGEESGLEHGVDDEAVDRRFTAILDAVDPDVVHLQHFKRLSATIPERCAERDVPCLATLHDFWTLCHREQLVWPSGALCTGPDSVAKCTACYEEALRHRDGRGAPTDGGPTASHADTGDPRESVQRRIARLEAAWETLDLSIAPSDFLRDRFLAFGTDPEDIVQRRNGIRVDAFRDTGFDSDEPLKIGYAGRITPAKGVHVLLSAFAGVDTDAELHVFGRFDPEGDAYHARLRERAGDGVTFHGTYEASSEPYEAVDIVVVPSQWYENSPLVIQEASASGVPAVVSDTGGMAEMVTDGEDGLTVPVGDDAALADTLRRLARDPGLVGRLRAGIEPPKSLETHAREVLALYERVLEGRREVGEPA